MADKTRDPVLDSVWLAERRPASATHAALSREAIVLAAVEELDAHGLAALSMRKLATRLGVAPMSLYWHVPTKDAVLELAVDEVFGDLPAADPAEPWRDAARAVMVAVRAMFHRHPWLARVQGSYPSIGPRSVALVESLLGTLVRAGLSPVEASRSGAVMISFVVGFAVSEVRWAQRTGAVEESGTGWLTQVSERYRERFPLFVAQFDAPELWVPDAQFDYGVDCVLAGVGTRTGQPPE